VKIPSPHYSAVFCTTRTIWESQKSAQVRNKGIVFFLFLYNLHSDLLVFASADKTPGELGRSKVRETGAVPANRHSYLGL